MSHNRGFVREPGNDVNADDCQELVVNLERFAVPEVLFSPRDIGLFQMGIPEAIATSVSRCPKGTMVQHLVTLFSNVLAISIHIRSILDFQQCMVAYTAT